MSTNESIQILQQMPVFGGIREATLALLLEEITHINVKKGDFFFKEGEHGNSMFVLTSGSVAVIKRHNDRNYLLATLEKGDCFGEMELIDLCPRSASVLATDDSAALEITGANLYRLYREDIMEFAMIHMNMGREVSRRLRKTDEKLFKTRMEASIVNGEYEFRPVTDMHDLLKD